MKRLASDLYYLNDLDEQAQDKALNNFYKKLYWNEGYFQTGSYIEYILDEFNSSFYDDTDVTYDLDTEEFGGEIDYLTILDKANCYTSEEDAFTEGTWQNTIYHMCEQDINPVGYSNVEDYKDWLLKLADYYENKLNESEYNKLIDAVYRMVDAAKEIYFDDIYKYITNVVDAYNNADDNYVWECLINYEGQNGPIFDKDGNIII